MTKGTIPKFWWDDFNKVIHVKVPKRKTLPASLIEDFFDLVKTLPEKVNILVDCKDTDVNADIKLIERIGIDPKYITLAEKKIKHIAVYGLDIFQRMKLEFMLTLADVDRIRLFADEKSALGWVKGHE